MDKDIDFLDGEFPRILNAPPQELQSTSLQGQQGLKSTLPQGSQGSQGFQSPQGFQEFHSHQSPQSPQGSQGFHYSQSPQEFEYTSQSKNYKEQKPYYMSLNCIDVANHLEDCPVCSKLHKSNAPIFISIIVFLLILIMFLGKRFFE